MLHFPSTLRPTVSSGVSRRTDGLNATQRKSGSDPVFLTIEEDLHDARRVKAHGQEEDLRLALDMVINRVTDLSSLLSEAYKTQADLEVQLNVAKSNLALVISNNEMLEEALRRDNTRNSKEIGWQRRSVKDGEPLQDRKSLDEWQQPLDASSVNENGPTSGSASPQTVVSYTAAQESGRFFKFRFASTSQSRPASRPGTPSTSASLSQLSSPTTTTIPPYLTKEIEDLNLELEKERSARKTVEKDKAALEAELESLSQALFEEANKMVATERIKLFEVEEELKEVRVEKEALKRALRLIEGENQTLRQRPSIDRPFESASDDNKSRSSSEIAIKSRPTSFVLESTYPLPESSEPVSAENITPTLPDISDTIEPDTARKNESLFSHMSLPTELEESSPWADIPPSTPSPSNPGSIHQHSSSARFS